ncbi:MAG: phosphodiester glycosidase family protein [Okeania sp. SIO3B5]|uniref:phosphodiester glycosidase family protein n=1 Tax=Okeania sp. SIO3B5 TaxID=2607811 RepID=UPI0014010550|nr:phosphodiester glycosidase family protein [Okeania sp. SIO3B5]NEO53195.1 phosphodiester glycosidase family protein [Okeania sp. SIO3B5]
MNKKIKIGFCVIVLLCLGGVGITVFQRAKKSDKESIYQQTIYPDSSFQDGEFMAYKFNNYDMTIVSFIGNFDLIYKPSQAESVKTVATKSNYKYIVNGSFFEESKEHAGWLSVLGKVKTPVKEDKQLSHIISFNPNTEELNFIETKLFEASTEKNNIEFQSGPLIIDSNQVTTKYINQSLNGLLLFERTLLAYTEEDRRKYFIITKENVKLDELADYLLKVSVFSGKTLHIVNLDGGSSVALYSQTHPELNFNETAILPILLGLK